MKNPFSGQMKVCIVAPVYNEAECLDEFFRRTRAVADQLKNNVSFEWIFVNDGSADNSAQLLIDFRKQDSRVKIITFSRNFGHQPAIKAGIDHANGDAIITIDTDLQDPPEAIPEMLEKWRDGFDVIYAVRASREGDGIFKKLTASLYYRLLKQITHIDIPLDAGDFRLISRKVADALKSMNEKRPFLRGLISWLGFRQTGITIKREPRFAGKTKYPLRKMLQFAWNGITHFSFFPLQLATWTGFGMLLFCFAELIHTLYVALILKIAVPGWASIMVTILFLGSVQLITLGILGSYLARNYDESRNRPLYLIDEKEGF